MSAITTTRKASAQDQVKIEQSILRYERTLISLRTSDVKEVRLMHGTLAHTIINDAILPIVDIKKQYIRAIQNRITELKYQLLEITEQ